MGEEGKDYVSEGSLEELGDKKYKEMFGEDEGHLLLIFREYPNESSNYIVTATPGYDAETQVMDEQAREILLDFVDYYYTVDDLNEGQFFGKAFEKAGDRIMMKQLSLRQLAVIVIVVLIVVIGLIIIANIRKKRKIAVAKQKTMQKQAAAQEAKAVAQQKQTDFNRKQYEDQLETEFVAVECPNCGSTGNKIRRTTVGYCPFCGTAIRVDKDGNVEFINRDDTSAT
jgi:RNA polymerase-binding transcription factor DksA